MKMRHISDLPLVAYLSITGHRIIEIKTANNKSIFVFEDSDGLEKDILAFYNRVGRVEPMSFSEVLRNLKALALKREGLENGS